MEIGSDTRVLVIGASGQVGRAVCASFEGLGASVTGAGFQHLGPGLRPVDLSDAASIRSVWADVRPDVVVLAASMCHVDGCELDPGRCRAINVEGTRIVAEQARDAGAVLVFYSTDHVFDGSKPAHAEGDPVAPLNVYAMSKVEGERVVRDIAPRHLILRTSWVFGPDTHRRNFTLRLIDALRQGRPMTIAADQWGSPTYTEDLARATTELVRRGSIGTWHVTGPDFVSREALAVRICEKFGLDRGLIVAKSTIDLGQPARRPLRVRLDTGRSAVAGMPAFRSIDEGLAALEMSGAAIEAA